MDSLSVADKAAAGYVMNRILIYMLLAALALSEACAFAQQPTPVEKVIMKYENVKGSQEVSATGAKMTIARMMIRKTPVGLIADDVDEVYVLRMGDASQPDRTDFLDDLRIAFKSYVYSGRYDSDKGLVDVYILPSYEGYTDELVIYNPQSYSLNSLRGHIPMSQLRTLEK